MANRVLSWLRSVDVRLALIALFVGVSTIHVGDLFSEREAARQAFAGYVLALAIDGVLAVSLYQALGVRRRSHRAFAFGVFAFGCAVSAGFNAWYYRVNYAGDPVEMSILLGATPPILAAALAMLKAMADVQGQNERQAERDANAERERALQLKMYTIEQAEQTRRLEIAEREQTKRTRASAKAEQARADALAEAQRTARKAQRTANTERRARGELDALAEAVLLANPGLGPRPLAKELGCSPSTAAGVLKRLAGGNGNSGG